MNNGGTEVPDNWIMVAGQEAVPRHFVTERTAHPRAGDVANVVEVKEQQGPELTRFEGLSGTGESVTPQTIKIDSGFEIDPHVPGGHNRWAESFSHLLPPLSPSSTLIFSTHICGPTPRVCSSRSSEKSPSAYSAPIAADNNLGAQRRDRRGGFRPLWSGRAQVDVPTRQRQSRGRREVEVHKGRRLVTRECRSQVAALYGLTRGRTHCPSRPTVRSWHPGKRPRRARARGRPWSISDHRTMANTKRRC